MSSIWARPMYLQKVQRRGSHCRALIGTSMELSISWCSNIRMIPSRAIMVVPTIFLAVSPCFSQSKPPARDPSAASTKTSTVEFLEPATTKIEDLFKQADVAVVVKILSGDTEHYQQAV